MSLSHRIKTFFTTRKSKMGPNGIEVVFDASINDEKEVSDKTVPVLNSISREAEVVLPGFLADAIHEPEVLSLRPSLGLPRFRPEDLVVPSATPPTPSSGYNSGRTLFITNGDNSAQSFSTAVTSLHSAASSLNTIASYDSTASHFDCSSHPILHLHDFVNVRGIGAGGFGHVYLVKYRPTNTFVALKVVEKRKCDERAVKNEQKALRNIATKGIDGVIEFLGSFHNPRHYFMVTPYYPRGDLKSLIARWKRLPATLSKHYAAELLSALEALHSEGIVHRDIKPDNVFIDENGHLVLGDLGLAVPVTPPGEIFVPGEFCHWRLKDMAGTLQYLSPEMWKGDPYDFSVDVWAYGCTVFEMMFGRTPWQGSLDDSDTVLERRVLEDTLDIYLHGEKPTKVAKHLLERLFQKDPDYRPTLDEVKEYSYFSGISWPRIKKRLIPVPDVGSSPVPARHGDPSIFFASFSSGGLYTEDEDPFPEFHYISAKLIQDDTPLHSRSHTATTESDDSPTATCCVVPGASTSSSSTSSFIEIDLDDDKSSNASLLSPRSGSLHSVRTSYDAPSPATIIISTVTTVMVVEEAGHASKDNGQEGTAPPPTIAQEEITVSTAVDAVGAVGAVGALHKPPSILVLFKSFVNKLVVSITKLCSLLPPRYP